ncbi:hypothetical protein ACE6H2_008330 [Prunus campanulata]
MEGGLIYSGSGKGYRNKMPAGLTGFVKSMNTSMKISLETDELLGSPSTAQLLHVRREHDESFGRAELYDDSSLQNQIEINVELV